MNKFFLNIIMDPGIQFSIGNAVLFWNGGGFPQLLSIFALCVGAVVKIYSEYSTDAKGIIKNPAIALLVVIISLCFIGIHAVYFKHYFSAIVAFSFSFGMLNACTFSIVDKFKKTSFNIVGDVPTKVITQPETFFTIGLGAVAYLSIGNVFLYYIPVPMLTFIPTFIGGVLAVRNVLLSYSLSRSKPLLWIVAGVAMTACSGFLSDALFPAVANTLFASAYLRIQALNDGGYRRIFC